MASKLKKISGLPLSCLLLSLLLNLSFVAGIRWDEPQQTSTISAQNALHNPIPLPTAGPFASHELLMRQELQSLATVCGYISGELSNPVTCATGYCGNKPSLNAVGCCLSYYVSTSVTTLDMCYFETACYDSTVMALCTGDCLTNTQVVRCTEAGYPACFSYTYTDIGSTILGCTTSQTVIEIQNDANTNPATTPTTSSAPASSSVIPSQSESLPEWVTTTYTGFSEASSPPAGPVTLGSSVSAGGKSSATSNFGSNRLEVIAAGVAGGIAGLVVLVGLFLYFCLRKRHDGFVAVGEPQAVMNR